MPIKSNDLSPPIIWFNADGSNIVTMYDYTPLAVHRMTACEKDGSCCIHNPSEHPLFTSPMIFNFNTQVMHRVCQHLYVHPDPDALMHWIKSYAQAWMQPKPTKVGVKKWLSYRYAAIREHECPCNCCEFPDYVTKHFAKTICNGYLRVHCEENGWTQIAEDLFGPAKNLVKTAFGTVPVSNL